VFTALSQCPRVSERACCNLKRKLSFVRLTQTDQRKGEKRRASGCQQAEGVDGKVKNSASSLGSL